MTAISDWLRHAAPRLARSRLTPGGPSGDFDDLLDAALTTLSTGCRRTGQFAGVCTGVLHGESARTWAKQGASGHTLTSEAHEELGMAYERITINPNQMGGLPCIRGLRIPVTTIVGQLAAGRSHDEILADFPDLEAVDIYAALEYAAAAVQERELPAVAGG